jgi:drug/metabolite transporter (DMT)-like permease
VRPRDVLTLVALSVIWGSAFLLVKVVLEEVDPLTLVAGRLVAGAAALSVAVAVTRRSVPRNREAWSVYAFLGIVNNVWPFVLLTWGQQHIDSSLAAILTASMPISTVLVAHFWIDERLTPDRGLGVLIGFAGVFVLIGGDLRQLTDSSTLAQLAILAGVLGYTVGTVFARRYLQQADPLSTAAGQTMVGAIVMVPLALAVDQPFDLDLSAKHAFAWTTLGILASGLAYLLYFSLIRRVTATQASMVSYLIPITAVSLGALVLDERLSMVSFAGLALIILGVFVVNSGMRWFSERTKRSDRLRGVEQISEVLDAHKR